MRADAEASAEARRDAASASPSRAPVRAPDPESREWLVLLRAEGAPRERAVARLHGLLLRAARFEVGRRVARSPHLRGNDAADIALQAADDALVAVLRRLDDYRGRSRFTTWAYKFALLEAATAVRRRAWQGRELPLSDHAWSGMGANGPSAHAEVAAGELLAAVRDAVERSLTERQREVFTALALNEVPIDVLAERTGSTRGALYKTLHDARRRVRAELRVRGLDPADPGGER